MAIADFTLLLEDGASLLLLENGSGLLLEPVTVEDDVVFGGGVFGEEFRPTEDMAGVLLALTTALQLRRSSRRRVVV